MPRKVQRIGIYSGTFNPVHVGHITFAMQAIQQAKLDKIYFLPERRPRHKTGVEHFGHRVAMLKRALRPHSRMEVLEFVDVSFTVERTLPQLQKRFKGQQLVFLMGSDVVRHLPDWPQAERLLESSELVVGVRAGDAPELMSRRIQTWAVQPQSLTVLQSYAPHVSSHSIREALRQRRYVPGLLLSVARYSNHHWLYVSLA